MAADQVTIIKSRAMGTDVAITVVGARRELAERALADLERLESLWSRFRPDSEISCLNAAAGEFVSISGDTRHLIETAVEAWRTSGGFVDCTRLQALVNAGYDRSFEQVPAESITTERTLSQAAAVMTMRRLRRHGPADIEFTSTSARLPVGLGFDPGGIGKGLAADMISQTVMDGGADGVCIDIGGDLRVRGVGPEQAGWTISIDHPHRFEPLAVIGLSDGAVASSTTLRRTWRVDGERRHHLIDPRTDRPSTSGVAFSTAIAANGWQAETMAKATLLRGGPHWFDLTDGSGMEVLIVTDEGDVHTSAGFHRYCAPSETLDQLDSLEQRVSS